MHTYRCQFANTVLFVFTDVIIVCVDVISAFSTVADVLPVTQLG